MATETTLEKAAAKTPAVITTPDEYRGAVLRWQEQHFNLLTPFSNISGLAPGMALYSSLVQVSIDKNQQEVYDGLPFLKRGEVAIAKRGLRKIAEGLGISTRLEYVSVGMRPHYWHVKAIASYRGVDGATIEREGSQEWDLTDGSARMKGWQPGQIQESRKHGLRQCETRAINAAIRECGCGIKQAYTAEELARPFVAIRASVQANMDNPAERLLVLERGMGSTNLLYPHRSTPVVMDAFAEDETAAPAAPVQAGSGSTAAAQEPKPEDRPPMPEAVRVVKVEEKHGKSEDKKDDAGNVTKPGRPWTRFIVVDSTGLESSTFDTKLAEAARKYRDEKTWVEIATEANGQYTNLIEIVVAGQQQSLPDAANL